ncbi:UDP-N-acetylmuramoyl-tripeptide--D-alanyl-D-alanine ligase [Geotalea uraniireducens]|uniref:UDP-N-acetylmuramoyl-tripeptide--D-alanyl-D-alanine ligase n=1 Tax=Geotalea uraniireducens (strain Rf4) TaxID=351605 RepID=A5G8K4_GEOUR|nr:UDP-N-acetylmuramoyl-tripeptide--D-alanyl-D-alanine ligase [Geotalea uraniireducens Rf4]
MFTIDEIIEATGGTRIGSGNDAVSGVSTDSRQVAAGELFVALKGERFDGHDYLEAAVARGVRAFLVAADRLAGKQPPNDVIYVAVPDTLRALGDLAAWHRSRFDLPLVGITGSNGKTTTKEMLATILAQTGPGLKTSGNLNNLIGLPLMLLRLTKRDRWAVLEMGMSEPGEIDRLAEMANPRIGVITNAFTAHLESMGSVEAVAKAKGELFMRLKTDGWAVYNADDPLISRCPAPAGVKRLSFGLRGAEVSSEGIESLGREGLRFTLRLPGVDVPVRMKAYGLHNVYNALAAAAAAHLLGVDPELIRSGLEEFTPYDKRFSLEEIRGVVLVDDSYNANPASMAAALVTLRDIREESRAIAILGDMLELGTGSVAAHREVGLLAATCVERLYAMGEMAETVAAGAVDGGLSPENIVVARTHEEIIADLRRRVAKGDNILVKGSRGMRMDIVAEAIRQGFALPGEKNEVA